MNCRSFLNLLTVGVTTFLVIWGGELLLALLWAPTSSPSRMIGFIASMFAVARGLLAVVWPSKSRS